MSEETRKNENEQIEENAKNNAVEADVSESTTDTSAASPEETASLIYVPNEEISNSETPAEVNVFYVPDENVLLSSDGFDSPSTDSDNAGEALTEASNETNEEESSASAIYVPNEVVEAKKDAAGSDEAPLIYVPDSEVGISTDTPAPTEFKDGVAYTKNADGNITNGYEWNGAESKSDEKVKKEKKESSRTGLKVLLTIMISIFSVATIVGLAYFIPELIQDRSKNKEQAPGNVVSGDIQNSDNYDYSQTTLNNENYVSYEFDEHAPDESLSIPEIAAKCTPSSVGIIAESEYTTGNFFFGYSTGIQQASGSGFVYSAEGYIITNHHVVEDADKITVVMHDGSEYEAEFWASDSLSDIAVLKIEPKDGEAFLPIELGDSNELVVGESVVAIGCPAGIEFINTVTDGIISSINRNVKLTDESGNTQKTMALIQTNATINHGNSGGPLINSRGQVIGINTLKLASDYEGIGFAIPINGAVSIINQLIDYKEVKERTDEDFVYGKSIIGIEGSDITEVESNYYDIPQGVLVVQIDKNSSAAKAGLKRGDIITHFNGKEVKSINELNNAKINMRPGTEVTVTVYRDDEGEKLTIKFKLEASE